VELGARLPALAVVMVSGLAAADWQTTLQQCLATDASCTYGTSANCRPPAPYTDHWGARHDFSAAALLLRQCDEKDRSNWSWMGSAHDATGTDKCKVRVFAAMPRVPELAKQLLELEKRTNDMPPQLSGQCPGPMPDPGNSESLRQVYFWCDNSAHDCARVLSQGLEVCEKARRIEECLWEAEPRYYREIAKRKHDDDCRTKADQQRQAEEQAARERAEAQARELRAREEKQQQARQQPQQQPRQLPAPRAAAIAPAAERAQEKKQALYEARERQLKASADNLAAQAKQSQEANQQAYNDYLARQQAKTADAIDRIGSESRAQLDAVDYSGSERAAAAKEARFVSSGERLDDLGAAEAPPPLTAVGCVAVAPGEDGAVPPGKPFASGLWTASQCTAQRDWDVQLGQVTSSRHQADRRVRARPHCCAGPGGHVEAVSAVVAGFLDLGRALEQRIEVERTRHRGCTTPLKQAGADVEALKSQYAWALKAMSVASATVASNEGPFFCWADGAPAGIHRETTFADLCASLAAYERCDGAAP
jgi:hypothetical protein